MISKKYILHAGKKLFTILLKVPGTAKAYIPTSKNEINNDKYTIKITKLYINNSLEIPNFSNDNSIVYFYI